MRVWVKAQKDENWHQDGMMFTYKPSRLNKTDDGKALGYQKRFYELAFTYDFKTKNDTVYFAYCVPYTFSKLQAHLKALSKVPESSKFLREEHFCYSLSGVSIPILTIT
jgi:hypothetical protein